MSMVLCLSVKRQPLCKTALPREQEAEGQQVGKMNEKSLDGGVCQYVWHSSAESLRSNTRAPRVHEQL